MGAHGHLAWLKVCGVVNEEEEAGCGCEKGADGFLTPYLLEPLPLGIEHKQCSEMTGKMIYHHRIQLHIKFQPENVTSIKLAQKYGSTPVETPQTLVFFAGQSKKRVKVYRTEPTFRQKWRWRHKHRLAQF